MTLCALLMDVYTYIYMFICFSHGIDIDKMFTYCFLEKKQSRSKEKHVYHSINDLAPSLSLLTAEARARLVYM